MLKMGKMDAFMRFDELRNSNILADESCPNYQIMVCTGAAEAGISSNSVYHAKQCGLPASFHALSQNLGRVNRQQTVAEPNIFSYEVHLSFDSVISLFVQAMRNDDAAERKQQLLDMKAVACLLVTPSECYHSALEKHFEVYEEPNKLPCQRYCIFCRDGMQHFSISCRCNPGGGNGFHGGSRSQW